MPSSVMVLSTRTVHCCSSPGCEGSVGRHPSPCSILVLGGSSAWAPLQGKRQGTWHKAPGFCSRVPHPCGSFCETGWNGRPHRRHICWVGGPGIWDIVFLAGSGGCQKPDKLITSDMGQSSFWRVQAGPPELPRRCCCSW